MEYKYLIRPLSPEILVNEKYETVHKTFGIARAGKSVKVGRSNEANETCRPKMENNIKKKI